MKKIDEKEIIELAKKDPEVFGQIFDEYYDQIFAYILRRVGDVHNAQNISSEVFFKALDRLWQFRWKNISISSWLYRIATNEINQYFRGKKEVVSLDKMLEECGFEISDEVDILKEIIDQENELLKANKWLVVRKEIQKLPYKYQEVLTLRFFEEKKISQISEILGKKEGTIKSLLSRAVSKLQTKCNQNDQIAF